MRRRRAILLFVLAFMVVGGVLHVTGGGFLLIAAGSFPHIVAAGFRHIAAGGLRHIAADGFTQVLAYSTLAAAAWTVAAAPVVASLCRDTLRALRGGALGVDVIALVAIGGALALGEFFTAALIALMVAGGNALEELAEARARREMTALLSRTPRTAHLLHGEAVTEVPIEAIARRRRTAGQARRDGAGGRHAAGRRGDRRIGADRRAGSGLVRPRRPGAQRRGQRRRAVRGFAPPPPPRPARSPPSCDWCRQREAERPPMVRLADRWAMLFLPFTLAVAGLAWWFGGSAERALAVWSWQPPARSSSPPRSRWSAAFRARRRHGVMVKGGGALERLARVRTALFDKTGTLTAGTPSVTGVEPLSGFGADEVLRLAASLDQMSSHVMAQAIVLAARGASLDAGHAGGQSARCRAAGSRARSRGGRCWWGTPPCCRPAVCPPPRTGSAARLAAAASSCAWLAVDGQVAGVLLLADRIRPEAPRALRALREAGIRRVVMVTGDRAETAEAVGTALGLDAVHAGLSPAGKIEVVKQERADRPADDDRRRHQRRPRAGRGRCRRGDGRARRRGGGRGGRRGAAGRPHRPGGDRGDHGAPRPPDRAAIGRRRHGDVGRRHGGRRLWYLPPVSGALLQEAIDVAVILNALRVLRRRQAVAAAADRRRRAQGFRRPCAPCARSPAACATPPTACAPTKRLRWRPGRAPRSAGSAKVCAMCCCPTRPPRNATPIPRSPIVWADTTLSAP